MTYCLEPGELISVGIRRLIIEESTNIQQQLTDPEIERDVGVHETRKSCKRVRAALRLVRDEIGEKIYIRENIRFRDIARRISVARDSWVMIEVLDRLMTNQFDDHPEQVFATFRDRLVNEYQETLIQEQADTTLVDEIMEIIQAAFIQVENLPIVREGFSAMEEGIRRTYTRGKRGMEKSISNPIPENFHEWRKRVKYFWHQLEILTNIRPDVLVRLGDGLHTLSDTLGDQHDLVLLKRAILAYP